MYALEGEHLGPASGTRFALHRADIVAIELDHELLLRTVEVRDVASERLLAPESAGMVLQKFESQLALGRRRIATQDSGVCLQIATVMLVGVSVPRS